MSSLTEKIRAITIISDSYALMDHCRCSHPENFDTAIKVETIDELKIIVCDLFCLDVTKLESGTRERNYVIPRNIIATIAFLQLGKTFTETGKSFGRDHTSALYGVTETCRCIMSDAKDPFTVNTKKRVLHVLRELNIEYGNFCSRVECYMTDRRKRFSDSKKKIKAKVDTPVRKIVRYKELTPQPFVRPKAVYSNVQY